MVRTTCCDAFDARQQGQPTPDFYLSPQMGLNVRTFAQFLKSQLDFDAAQRFVEEK